MVKNDAFYHKFQTLTISFNPTFFQFMQFNNEDDSSLSAQLAVLYNYNCLYIHHLYLSKAKLH